MRGKHSAKLCPLLRTQEKLVQHVEVKEMLGGVGTEGFGCGGILLVEAEEM